MGKSVIAGKSLVSYERHEFLEKASQFFSLSDPASVIMTDQSPGFTLAVENMQQTHLLCQKHFTTEMLHATTGMDQEIRTKFMNECHSAILDDLQLFVDRFKRLILNCFTQIPCRNAGT